MNKKSLDSAIRKYRKYYYYYYYSKYRTNHNVCNFTIIGHFLNSRNKEYKFV